MDGWFEDSVMETEMEMEIERPDSINSETFWLL